MPTVARLSSRPSGGWSRCPGSNWRPRPYQGRALPTELHRPASSPSPGAPTEAHARLSPRERRLERETGIEPATNSLEGCDSTTELLPQLPALPSGGEGRIRTFEATGATDLQSVAFDRFATSPNRAPAHAEADALSFMGSCVREPSVDVIVLSGLCRSRICRPASARVCRAAGIVELAKGFEPPTG